MKMFWLVPLGILIGFLMAWPLRWVNGPTQTGLGQKVGFMKDRWFGQEWATLYGGFNGENYDNKVIAIPSLDTIQKSEGKLSFDPKYAPTQQYWQQKVNKYTSLMDRYWKGHAEYLRLIILNNIKDENSILNFTINSDPKDNILNTEIYSNPDLKAFIINDQYSSKVNRPLQDLSSLVEMVGINVKLPAAIVADNRSWEDAYNKMLDMQISEETNQTISDYTKQAWKRRNDATEAWIFPQIPVFFIGLALFLNWRESKHP